MSETITIPRKEVREEEKVKRQPPYNVILLNDDDHTYDYVIAMLQSLFGHPPEKGYQMAKEVDTTGAFDPNVHEAVATEESDAVPPQTILQVLQRGYMLQDRLVRPALVKVAVPPDEGNRETARGVS